ncbi:MAG: hypothetical protein ACK2UO_14450 [Caldilineaceae bacterium]
MYKLLLSLFIFAFSAAVAAVDFSAYDYGNGGLTFATYGYGDGHLTSETALYGEINLVLVNEGKEARVYKGKLDAQVVGLDDSSNYLVDYSVALANNAGALHLTGVTGTFTPIDDLGCAWVEPITATLEEGVLRDGDIVYSFVPGGIVFIVAYANYCTRAENYVITGGQLAIE